MRSKRGPGTVSSTLAVHTNKTWGGEGGHAQHVGSAHKQDLGGVRGGMPSTLAVHTNKAWGGCMPSMLAELTNRNWSKEQGGGACEQMRHECACMARGAWWEGKEAGMGIKHPGLHPAPAPCPCTLSLHPAPTPWPAPPHLAQVYGHVHVVVQEAAVLLRVKQLEQGRGRVAWQEGGEGQLKQGRRRGT